MGLLPGERVVSRMSLGRKNSMYGRFKGAPGTQFRGFHAAAQLHCCARLPTLDGRNFLVRASFWVFLDSMESPFRLESIHIYLDKIGTHFWSKNDEKWKAPARAGNEPSYSGSARARLEKSSARAQLVS